jgi:hypothetical protein
MTCSIIGNKNASVFPLPVLACAIMSRPFSATGIAACCTGVGVVKPACVRRWTRDWGKFISTNVDIKLLV